VTAAVFSVIFAFMGCAALAFLVLIFVDDWRDLQGRGEVADVPELPPCGVRLVLTEEQIVASIAEMEKQFPKTRPRRIR
jgi:hypothetical protein